MFQGSEYYFHKLQNTRGEHIWSQENKKAGQCNMTTSILPILFVVVVLFLIEV